MSYFEIGSMVLICESVGMRCREGMKISRKELIVFL